MGETTHPSPGLSPKGRGVGLFRSISPRVVAWSLALVSILSLWVFRSVLANGFVDWDDHIYLGELERMGRFSWSSLRWMWTLAGAVLFAAHRVDDASGGLPNLGIEPHRASRDELDPARRVRCACRHAGLAADREGQCCVTGQASRKRLGGSCAGGKYSARLVGLGFALHFLDRAVGDERADRAGVRDSSVAGGIGRVGRGAQRAAVLVVDGGGVVRVRAGDPRRRRPESRLALGAALVVDSGGAGCGRAPDQTVCGESAGVDAGGGLLSTERFSPHLDPLPPQHDRGVSSDSAPPKQRGRGNHPRSSASGCWWRRNGR